MAPIDLFDLVAKISLDSSEYDRGIDSATQKASGFASKLGSGLATAGSMAVKGLGVVAGAATGAVGGLLALEESTEEYRIAQGKLNTAFEAAGYSADTAQQAYTAFYGILGDTDTATEASQLLAQLAENEEDVATWTDIAAGVAGTFGDSLPIEGLIEASNETAKVGEVTGSLADALNWVGISEDEFNAKLEACSSESERNALIMDTLAGTYDDASDAFYRNNEALVEGRENQALLDETLGNLGNTVSTVKNKLMSEFLPGIADATDALSGMISGVEGSDEQFSEAIGGLIEKFVEELPKFLEFGGKILMSILSGIAEALPALAEKIPEIVTSIGNTFSENLPALASKGVEVISSLAAGIGEALPVLIPAAVEAILSFVSGLTQPESLSNLIDAALGIIQGLIEGLVKAVPKLIEYAPEIIANLISGIIAALPDIIDTGIQLIMGLVEGLIEGIKALPEAIGRVVNAVIDGFKSLFGIHSPSTVFAEMGGNLIAGLLEGISAAWETIIEFFSTAAQALIDFLSGAWETIREGAATAWDAIANVFSTAWETIQNIWSTVVEFFQNIWTGIQNAFATVAEFFGGIFSSAWTAIQTAWANVVQFFQDIWTGIQNIFSVVAEVLGGFFSSAWEEIQNVWSAAVGFFTDIWNNIQTVFSVVAEVLGGFFSAAWEKIKSVWGSVVGFFRDIWNGIVSIFGGAAEWFGNIFKNAWNAIKNAFGEVKDFFSGIWDTISGAFSDAAERFADIGSDIVHGLWIGISGAADWLWNKVSGWANDLIDGVLSIFDINSPSKEFAWIGKMIVEGLSGSIDQNGGKAVRSMENWSRDLLSTMSTSVPQASVSNASALSPFGAASWQSGSGNTYVTINSPKAVDGVQAAREWRKTAQRLAMSY